MSILVLVTILNYGAFYDRGPSADDFCHAKKCFTYSYYDEVADTIQEAPGSRLTISFLYPALFRLFSADSLLNFHWEYFHLIGLLFHIGNVVLIYVILGLFDLPAFMRLLVPLLFSIHPIKSEILLWCTPIGYAISFFIFLLCTYSYLLLAKKNHKDNTIFSLSIFTVWLIPVFSIEQILPLIPIIMILKYLVFRPKKRTAIIESLYFIVLTVFYIFVTFIAFSGSTANKVHSMGRDQLLSLDLSHALSSIVMLLYRTLIPPFAYPYNEYVWNQLLSGTFLNGINLLTIFVVMLFVSLLLYFARINRNMAKDLATLGTDHYIQLIAIGLLVTLATLSPLLVTGYSFESRTLYIPMLGISLLLVGFACWAMRLINQVLDKSSFKGDATLLAIMFNVIIILFVSFSSLTNLTFQGAYAQAWDIKKRFLLTLEENFPSVPSGSEAYIFGLPKKIGPAPVFADPWSLSCVFHATYGQQVEATAMQPVFSMLSESNITNDKTLENIIPLAWSDDDLKPITRIDLIRIQNNGAMKQEVFFRETEKFGEGIGLNLTCLVKDIALNAIVSDSYRLTRISIYLIPQIDQIEAQVEIEPIGTTAKANTVFCHYIYDDNTAPVVEGKSIPSSDLKPNRDKLLFTFKGNHIEVLEKIRIGFAPAKMYWERLEIDFKSDQELVKLKDKAIELDISDIKELLGHYNIGAQTDTLDS